jgi:cytochrome c oxidase subunit IV
MSEHGHPPPNIKLYMTIFGTLLVLTVLTVLVSYWHLPPAAAIAVGLAIASFKAGLVVAFFMHLKGEHKLVWVFLGLMAFTLIGFFLVPMDFHFLRGRTEHTNVAAQHGHGSPEGAAHEMPAAGEESHKAPEGAH